jgi:hypothetical protein
MSSSKPADRSFVVVISSCDDYSDLWPYFFHFFFNHWPDAPQPIYLIANQRRYADPRVNTILVGPDQQWGSNTYAAISQIDAEFVLLLLDDFFFDAPFPMETFHRTLEQFQAAQGRLLELRPHGTDGEPVENTWFRRADPQNLKAGINSNLWRKDQLLEIAQPGLNIWKCESLVRKKLREGERSFFYMDESAPKQISFVEGVRGRFWKPEGLAYMRKNGIKPDLKWRPCPPQGEGFFAKLVRSVLKRRMEHLRYKMKGITLPDMKPLAFAASPTNSRAN